MPEFFSRITGVSRWLSALIISCLTFSCANKENTSDYSLGYIAISVSVPVDTIGDFSGKSSLTISSDDGKFSHTWTDYHSYQPYQGFYAGSYTAKVVFGVENSEGYGCACYTGETKFEVSDNNVSEVSIDCSLSQAVFNIEVSSDLLKAFHDVRLTGHTADFNYISIDNNSKSPLYLMPGSTSFMITLTDDTGRDVTISPNFTLNTVRNEEYNVSIDYSDDMLILVSGTESDAIEISESLFSSPSPSIKCAGFIDGMSFKLTEGLPADEKIEMIVDAEAGLSQLVLTSLGMDNDVPRECDLLKNPQQLQSKGLQISQSSDSNITIDFTTLLEEVVVDTSSDLKFLLCATDRLGRASNVAVLKVSINGVDVQLLDSSKAVLGVNSASVTLGVNEPKVEIKDFSLYIDDGHSSEPLPLNIVTTDSIGSGSRLILYFDVPEGIASVPIRIDYMDKTKLYTSIEREVPNYDFKIDAFATTIMAVIKGETPQITRALTKYSHILVNGKETTILKRDIDNGELFCAGFDPSTKYTVESFIIKDRFVPSTIIRTEAATSLPEGDFEEAELTIDYKRFPSGGVYSSTSFPIYNQQNLTDINVFWPKKHWASINQKTFCKNAKKHNTWYMQPSAQIDYNYFVSGSKSIKITSVGWSLNGEDIPPYTQEPESFMPYNANSPAIDMVSAGFLYIGDYSFDAATLTEVYSEGMKFGSRPSSLNGYFRYLPDDNNPSDCGWVLVEILNIGADGTETVLSRGRMEFSNAPDFRSFNLPLNYDVFFVPANHLRLMFCSSIEADGLSLENPDVPVSVNVPEAKFEGSSLWIDNLSFSY